MNSKLTKKINIAALAFVLLVIIAAVFLRKQTVSYDLVGNMDSSITLGAGETVMQTYSPNRRAITEFVFRLSEETSLDGTYTLIVTDKETPEEEPLLTISNEYDGETTDALVFRTSQKYDPKPSIRLNLFIQSDAGNRDSIELASCSALRSASYYDEAKGELTLSDSTLALTIVSEKNYKWFLLMYILLITMGTTFIFTHFFKSPFEDNVALGIIAAVLFAYFLGLIGLLKFAPAALFIVALAGVVLYFLDCIKKEVPFYKGISFGMILWAAVVLVLFVTVHHNIIGDPDSAFHINKARYMFWTDDIAYYPGYYFFLQLLATIFDKVNGIFTEDISLFSILLYDFSLLFVFLNVVKAKDPRMNNILKIIMMGLCTVLAIAIHPGSFFTIMMDVPFAITLAYIIKVLYDRNLSKETLIKLICASLALMLIKRSGFPVVLILALIMIVHAFRFNKTQKRFDRRYIIGMILILLTCVVVGKAIDIKGNYVSEKVISEDTSGFLYRPQVSDDNKTIASESLVNTTQTQPQSEDNNHSFIPKKIENLIERFDDKLFLVIIRAFFATNVFFGFSYAEVLGVFFLIGAITWLFKKDVRSAEFFIDIIELLVATLIYFAAVAYKYLYAIEFFNKYNLNAYDRYTIHFTGAVTLFALVSLIGILHRDNEEKNGDLRLIVLSLVFFAISCLKIDFSAITRQVNADIVAIEDRTDDLERVLATCYGTGHHMAVYSADSTFDQISYYVKRINVERWDTNISFNTDYVSSKDARDAYERYLNKGYEYLYLINYDNAFLKYCPDMFENGESDIKRHALYRVDKNEDETATLVYLGQIPMEDTILRTPDGKAKLGD